MRHLRALLALGEELNFTRAAQRLHLTQQALSGQIRQLEERVGTRLVERDTRRVALTRAGQTLYGQARPPLASAERAITATRDAGTETSRLTIGYIAPLTRRIVAPAIERYAAEEPQVELRIHFASFLDPLAGLREGASDVAFLYGKFEHEGIELHHLFSEPRGVALARDHPLAASAEVTIEEFVREPLIEVPTRDARWNDYWIAAEHRGREPAQVAASVHTLDGLIEAIAVGLGAALTVAPDRSAAPRIGTCSSDKPRFFALPPRLRGWRSGRVGADLPCLARFHARSPLRLARTKVSSASTMPRSFPASVLIAPR